MIDGYTTTTYGDRFADVYDDWYRSVTDVDATVVDLLALAGPDARILELGVGTGRIALPLAAAGAATGVSVVGVDASAAMLAVLAGRDPQRSVTAIEGDMVDDLPPGPFELAFVACNTLFNLTDPGAHESCFRAVAERLVPGGRFVVEAFVPDTAAFADGDRVEVRSMTADAVVLSISRHHPDDQRAEGQFVEFSETGGVRLRPWSIRYATTDQLDAAAHAANLTLEHRWQAFGGTPFTPDSPRHVSVYLTE